MSPTITVRTVAATWETPRELTEAEIEQLSLETGGRGKAAANRSDHDPPGVTEDGEELLFFAGNTMHTPCSTADPT